MTTTTGYQAITLREKPTVVHRIRGLALGLTGWIAVVLVVVFTIMAIAGPALAPHDPYTQDLLRANNPPAPGYPLGFDYEGRDILSRVLAGARTSLLGPLLVVILGAALATLLAVTAAWARGWWDASVNVVFDFLLAFPGLLLAVLSVAVFGKGLVAPVVALAIAYMPAMGRIVRSGARSETSMDYVTALRALGVPARLIVFRHLVPNVTPLIIAQATTLFGFALLDLSAISFLGLGVQEPQPDWGLMVNTGAAGVLLGHPAESLSAGTCLALAACAFTVLGLRLSRRIEGR